MSVSSENKRIITNTLFLYVRMILLMLVSLFTSRIVLQALGVVDYGLNNVIAGVIVVFSYVNNSMASATSRFLSFELGKRDLNKLKTVFANAFLVHAFLALIVLILGESIGIYVVNFILNIPPDRMYACNVLYQFVVCSACLTIMQVPFNALIIAHEHMSVYAYIGIFDAVVKCIVAYALLITPFDKLITYGTLNFCLAAITFLIYICYCRLKFRNVFYLTLKPCKSIVKQMTGFAVWGLWGSSSIMMRNTGINILLNIFFGSVVNAANAIAYQVNAAVTNFTNNFTMAINPQIIKTYAAGDRERNKNLIYRGGKFSFFLMIMLCYPVIFETNYLLGLWLGDYPEYAAVFTRLVLLLSIVEIFNPSIGCAVQATGRIKSYQVVVSSVTLMNFPITLILFKLGFPPYAALSISIGIAVITLFIRLNYLNKLLGIKIRDYIKSVMYPCSLVGLLSLVTPVLIYKGMDDGFIRLLTMFLANTIVSVLIIMWLGLKQNERAFLLNYSKGAYYRIFRHT